MSQEEKANEEARYLGLHNLAPEPGSKHARRRVGRGHKGFNSRSGGGVRAGYEGGQMPLYMRLGKLRGPNKKMSMPFGPFRTQTAGVNVSRLADKFEAGAEVTPQALVEKGIIKNTKTPVKILGHGDIAKALTVKANGFSKSAREKIEAAGGKAEVI